MNPEFSDQLAAQVKADPLLFERMDEALLGELIFLYSEGDLTTEDSVEVSALIEKNPAAKKIYQRILDANRFSASEEGAAWLRSLPGRVLPPSHGQDLETPPDADRGSTLVIKCLSE